MTARSGMGAIIQELRVLTNAGTADYTIAGSVYFSDDQLQGELDKTQRYYRYTPLDELPLVVSGTSQYFDYQIPDVLGQYIEQNQTGSGWVVRDSAGGSVSASGYTVNYNTRRVTFASDQAGAAYYLDCNIYDINAAAAMVWDMKAGIEAASSFDWSSDNHSVKRSQKVVHCQKMAEYYRNKAVVRPQGVNQTGRFVRSDENESRWLQNTDIETR